jgi:hypothetical protein
VARAEAEPFSGLQGFGQIVSNFESASIVAPSLELQEGFKR